MLLFDIAVFPTLSTPWLWGRDRHRMKQCTISDGYLLLSRTNPLDLWMLNSKVSIDCCVESSISYLQYMEPAKRCTGFTNIGALLVSSFLHLPTVSRCRRLMRLLCEGIPVSQIVCEFQFLLISFPWAAIFSSIHSKPAMSISGSLHCKIYLEAVKWQGVIQLRALCERHIETLFQLDSDCGGILFFNSIYTR